MESYRIYKHVGRVVPALCPLPYLPWTVGNGGLVEYSGGVGTSSNRDEMLRNPAIADRAEGGVLFAGA